MNGRNFRRFNCYCRRFKRLGVRVDYVPALVHTARCGKLSREWSTVHSELTIVGGGIQTPGTPPVGLVGADSFGNDRGGHGIVGQT